MKREERDGGSGWETEATMYEQAQGGCPDSLNELMRRVEGVERQRGVLYSLKQHRTRQRQHWH